MHILYHSPLLYVRKTGPFQEQDFTPPWSPHSPTNAIPTAILAGIRSMKAMAPEDDE